MRKKNPYTLMKANGFLARRLKFFCKPCLSRGFMAFSFMALASCLSTVSAEQFQTAPTGSVIQVTGDSNVHAWHAHTTNIQARLTHPDFSQASTGQEGTFEGLIPAESLKSGKAGMDKIMYKTLNTSDHPSIRFAGRIKPSEKAADPSPEQPEKEWLAEGTLTVAGTSQPFSFPLSVEASTVTTGVYTVSGNLPLTMTSFGLTPPKALMGMVKAADEITVHVLWVIQPTLE